MDTIFLTGLRTDAVIGIYDWERNIRQLLIVDLEMATDITRASATDDIQYTLNYKSISDRVMAFVTDSSFGLLETLAEQIAALVRDEFHVPWVRVTVHKPDAIEAADDLGVSIVRGERQMPQA